MQPVMPEILYRLVESLLYDGENMKIEMQEYHVLRRTRKGAWITRRPWTQSQYGTKPRFVLDGNGKRFAYPTTEAALGSFLARKRMQIYHLETQLTIARAAQKIASREDFQPGEPFPDDTLSQFTEY